MYSSGITYEESEENGSSIIPTSVNSEKSIAAAKTWHYAQIALIFLLIIGVWTLVSLPIILYNLPKSEVSYDLILIK